jgi:hypothetical protein
MVVLIRFVTLKNKFAMHTLTERFASVVKKGVPALLMAGLLFSCSKETFNTGVNKDKIEITDKKLQKKIIAQAEKMPSIGIYNKTFSQQTDCLKLLTGKMEDDSTMLQALNEVSGAIIGYLAIIIPLLALL